MVERGVVRLDDPVRELIPAAGVPRPAGNEIRLLDLATHRSGLPSMPASFRPANSANPAADFDVARLYNFLRGRGVDRRVDAPFIYSNLGFGLLAHALSQRAGGDYATLLRQVIAEPLGMNDTTVNLSPEQQRRFIHGYDDYRRPVPAWDFDVLAGAGGLRSTAPDMLSWLEANLHPERVRDEGLSKAIVSSHQVHSTMNASVDIALAWWFIPIRVSSSTEDRCSDSPPTRSSIRTTTSRSWCSRTSGRVRRCLRKHSENTYAHGSTASRPCHLRQL